MLVPSNMSLFNNTTKILCKYDPNKREKLSSTNLAEPFIHALPFWFLTACLVICTRQSGAVVILGIFWILQMDFREVIYTTSGLQGRLRSLKSHQKVNLLC